jgi:hypothetical protein
VYVGNGLSSELSSLLQAKINKAESKSSFFILIKLVYTLIIRIINLTYLRGLEVAELKEEDMPMV